MTMKMTKAFSNAERDPDEESDDEEMDYEYEDGDEEEYEYVDEADEEEQEEDRLDEVEMDRGCDGGSASAMDVDANDASSSPLSGTSRLSTVPSLKSSALSSYQSLAGTEGPRSFAVDPAYCGLKVEGALLELLSELPARSAVLPVYKQLAEFCLVDIDGADFFTATVTIKAREQFLLLQLRFPSNEPYFPAAPPQLDLKSVFRPPNQALNLLFNHHPLLLPLRWNLCADVAQVVRDLAGAAARRGVTVEMYDDDEERSVYRRLVDVMREAAVDITALFPTTQLHALPSFGVLEGSVQGAPEKGAGQQQRGFSRGTGYSSNTNYSRSVGSGSSAGGKSTWSFSDHLLTRIQKLQQLVKSLPRRACGSASSNASAIAIAIAGGSAGTSGRVGRRGAAGAGTPAVTAAVDDSGVTGSSTAATGGQREESEGKVDEVVVAAADHVVVDGVYFVVGSMLSPSVTPEEFFRHSDFYAAVLHCLLPLPRPSAHIEPPLGLLDLYRIISTSSEVTSSSQSQATGSKSVDGRGNGSLLAMLEAAGAAAEACGAGADNDDVAGARLVRMLGKLYSRFVPSENTMTATPVAVAVANTEVEVVDRGAGAVISNRKRHLDDAISPPPILDDSKVTAVAKESRRSKDPSSGGGGGGGEAAGNVDAAEAVSSSSPSQTASIPSALPIRPVPPVVVYVEDAFPQHRFNSLCAPRLTASWLRRLRIELLSLPDCLPRGSACVLSGMQAGQPQLLKLLLFPESLDCPYCGGAFEFDVFLPEDYPRVPPKVQLITTGSGAVRFNPNLYACGKVCLSLLGTWEGEPWDPKVSNLAQVAQSILFLIFVDEPYFNEPGFELQRGTPVGDARLRTHCRQLQVATLRHAYLDHFRAAGITTTTTAATTTTTTTTSAASTSVASSVAGSAKAWSGTDAGTGAGAKTGKRTGSQEAFLREYLLPGLCAAWRDRGDAAVGRIIAQVEGERREQERVGGGGAQTGGRVGGTGFKSKAKSKQSVGGSGMGSSSGGGSMYLSGGGGGEIDVFQHPNLNPDATLSLYQDPAALAARLLQLKTEVQAAVQAWEAT